MVLIVEEPILYFPSLVLALSYIIDLKIKKNTDSLITSLLNSVIQRKIKYVINSYKRLLLQQNIFAMDFLKKCCQCYFCSYAACNTAMCIDQWHSIEACGLSSLYCNACCWTLCAPLCIDCKLGDTSKAC